MSDFQFTARLKEEPNLSCFVVALDNHYGQHKYGYQVPSNYIDRKNGDAWKQNDEWTIIGQKKFDKLFERVEEDENSSNKPLEAGDSVQLEKQIQPIYDEDDPRSRTFLLTDACLWEQNKGRQTYHPHAIEVVDTETGQVRFIESGARIKFVEGSISEGRDQDKYNKYA